MVLEIVIDCWRHALELMRNHHSGSKVLDTAQTQSRMLGHNGIGSTVTILVAHEILSGVIFIT
jgi:hypothetical protein